MEWLQTIDWDFVLTLVLIAALMIALHGRGRDVPPDVVELWINERKDALDRLEKLADKTRTPADDALVDLSRVIVPAIEDFLGLDVDIDDNDDTTVSADGRMLDLEQERNTDDS